MCIDTALVHTNFPFSTEDVTIWLTFNSSRSHESILKYAITSISYVIITSSYDATDINNTTTDTSTNATISAIVTATCLCWLHTWICCSLQLLYCYTSQTWVPLPFCMYNHQEIFQRKHFGPPHVLSRGGMCIRVERVPCSIPRRQVVMLYIHTWCVHRYAEHHVVGVGRYLTMWWVPSVLLCLQGPGVILLHFL